MTRSAGLGFGELRQGLQDLGLGRAPIVVAHVSLRSFGRVDGGARTVIAALRSLIPTVVMPTFTYETMLPAPPHAGVPNNAAREAASWDDFHHALASTDPYRPDLPPSKAMGAVALALLREPTRNGARRRCSRSAEWVRRRPASCHTARRTII